MPYTSLSHYSTVHIHTHLQLAILFYLFSFTDESAGN
jgi:hypothetical protein